MSTTLRRPRLQDLVAPIKGADQISRASSAARLACAADPSIINATLGVYYDDVQSATTGRPYYMPSVQSVIAELVATNPEAWSAYPPFPGVDDFRYHATNAVLGDHFVERAKDQGLRQVTVATTGGSGAVRMSFDLMHFLGVRSLITRTPCWGPYNVMADAAGLKTRQEFDGPWGFTALEKTGGAIPLGDAIESSYQDHGRVYGLSPGLIISDPSNPTGWRLSEPERFQLLDTVNRIAEKGLSGAVCLCIDLAYNAFTADSQAWGETILEYDKRFTLSDNVLVMFACSFSKSHTLYSARCGALTMLSRANSSVLYDRLFGYRGLDREGVDTIEQAALYDMRTMWSAAPGLGQHIIAALHAGHEMLSEYHVERETMANTLRSRIKTLQNAVSDDVRIITGSEGFFLTFPCDDPLERYEDLVRAGVYTVPLEDVGVRVATCCVNSDKIPQLAEALNEHLAG